MRFNLSLFDAPAKGSDKNDPMVELPTEVTASSSVDLSPEKFIKEPGPPREVIQVCRDCKKKVSVLVDDWSTVNYDQPVKQETDKEKADRVLRYCKVFVERDHLLRHMEILPITYAMLEDKSNNVDGKTMFEVMDPATRAMFGKAAKLAYDYIVDKVLEIKTKNEDRQ